MRRAKGNVVLLLVVLDDALGRRVGDVLVAGSEQEQCRHCTREAAVAVLKGMDREEVDGEAGDDDDRVYGALLERGVRRRDELAHEARGIERRGGLEEDLDPTVRVRRLNGVGKLLVAAPVTFILDRVTEKYAV